MKTNKQEYHTSFFRPTSDITRANRNMVLWLVLIWAVAVFGFHFLLKIIEKPTPEPTLLSYEQVKENAYNGTADLAEMQEFAKVPLQVLCKVFLSEEDRIHLQSVLTWAVFKTVNEDQVDYLYNTIKEFEDIEANTTDILDPNYQESKVRLMNVAAQFIGLSENDIRAKFLPLELNSDYPESLSAESITQFETILNKYLIHNESVLTRIKFLGFPFHYFYTAVFLLVLFIFLCWLYCIRTDALNKKYGIED
jgi:putative solute:sodium symporter small subunit